jgi:hypothetical protein
MTNYRKFISVTAFTIVVLLLISINKRKTEYPRHHQNPNLQINPPISKPGQKVNWINFTTVNQRKDNSWGDFLLDIKNHLPESMIKQFEHHDRNTDAHESTHGIHAYLNNTFRSEGRNYHLYVGYNKATRIKQPNVKIADVANLVPNSLKKSRFNLYLVQQRRDWNNDPIYLWDEWVAYCNGAECGIELINKKMYSPGKNDSSWGVLEFNVYATYVAIAQKKHDPSYDNKQLLEFLAWNLERGMKLYKEGQKLEAYNWDNDEYLKHLQTHPDAAEFRNFIITNYGTDWAKEVFGFQQ